MDLNQLTLFRPRSEPLELERLVVESSLIQQLLGRLDLRVAAENEKIGKVDVRGLISPFSIFAVGQLAANPIGSLFQDRDSPKSIEVKVSSVETQVGEILRLLGVKGEILGRASLESQIKGEFPLGSGAAPEAVLKGDLKGLKISGVQVPVGAMGSLDLPSIHLGDLKVDLALAEKNLQLIEFKGGSPQGDLEIAVTGSIGLDLVTNPRTQAPAPQFSSYNLKLNLSVDERRMQDFGLLLIPLQAYAKRENGRQKYAVYIRGTDFRSNPTIRPF